MAMLLNPDFPGGKPHAVTSGVFTRNDNQSLIIYINQYVNGMSERFRIMAGKLDLALGVFLRAGSSALHNVASKYLFTIMAALIDIFQQLSEFLKYFTCCAKKNAKVHKESLTISKEFPYIWLRICEVSFREKPYYFKLLILLNYYLIGFFLNMFGQVSGPLPKAQNQVLMAGNGRKEYSPCSPDSLPGGAGSPA